MKKISNNVWTDGVQYWVGKPKNLMGPFDKQENAELAAAGTPVEQDDSSIVDSGEVVVFPRNE